MAIVGHKKQIEFLNKSVEADRLSHAYLFCGPDKVGKKNAALEWISKIFKSEIREGKAHPDFFFVKANEETNNIKIEQVRDLIWRLSLKPVVAPLKAAVIDNAHLMTADSQNCLLKTLEEPGGQTLIILIAHNPRLLLSTVVSRCETVRFNFVSSDEVGGHLKKEFGGNPGLADLEEIIRLSFGRPGRAVDFITDPKELEKWQTEIKDLSRAVSGGLGERFKYVKNISEGKKIEEILEIWSFYFRGLMLEALKGKENAGFEAAGSPKAFEFSKTKTNPYSLAKIVGIIKKIQQLVYVLSATNVNEKLALEALMLEI
jgi:DNA polymerase-3 subunit delta'